MNYIALVYYMGRGNLVNKVRFKLEVSIVNAKI